MNDFLYRFFGLAQWNLAYSIALFLRDNIFGFVRVHCHSCFEGNSRGNPSHRDGPIVSVDDDGMVKPELFRRIWRVNKVITWQVGNFWTIDHPGSTCES